MQPSGNSFLDSYRSSGSYGAAPVQAQPQQPQAKQGPTGLAGFLINNLPAIGGGLGAVAGIPLDFLGGAGSIAGAGLGASGGEALKEKLLGQNLNAGEIATQGLESAALGGAGKAFGAVKGLAQGTLGIAKAAAPEAVAAGDAALQATNGAKTGGNMVTRFLNNKATQQAQASYDDKVNSEFGLPGTKTAADNGTPINSVLSTMQGHRIEPGVTNMAKFGNAGFSYNDVLNNAIVPKGTPVQLDMSKVIKSAFQDQPGLGAVGARGSQATQIASGLRNTITNSLDPQGENISGIYHPGDLLKAAQDLYNAAPANAAEGKVFANARTALINAAGSEGGLNAAIKSYKLPSVQEALATGAEDTQGARDVQHIMQMSGGNPTLTQDIIDNINKAESIQGIQKAEIPHIAANDIAQSAAKAAGKALPNAPTGNTGGGFSLTGSPSGAYYATRELMGAAHNPLMALPLAAGRVGEGVIGKAAAKFGTADMSQVGPRPTPSLANEAPAAPATPGAELPTAPEAVASSEPVTPPVAPAPPSRLAQALPTLSKMSGATGNFVNEQLPTVAAAGKVAGAVGKLPLRMAAAPLALPGKSALAVGKQIGGRVVGDVANAALGGGQPPVTSGTPGTDGTGFDQSNATLGGIADGGAGGTGAGQTSPYSEASMMADIQRDPKNAATYQSLYKTLNPGSTKNPLTTVQQNGIVSIKDAATALDNYSQGLQKLGSSTGVGTGTVNALLGKLGVGDTNKQVYALESQRTDLATQLAKAVTGGKPSSTQIEFWKESLPSVGESSGSAQAKLNMVAKNLQAYLDNARTPVGAGEQPAAPDTSGLVPTQ